MSRYLNELDLNVQCMDGNKCICMCERACPTQVHVSPVLSINCICTRETNIFLSSTCAEESRCLATDVRPRPSRRGRVDEAQDHGHTITRLRGRDASRQTHDPINFQLGLRRPPCSSNLAPREYHDEALKSYMLLAYRELLYLQQSGRHSAPIAS